MMTYRDSASDSARLGQGDSPVRGRALCVEQDFTPDTIADQNAQGGYNRKDMPSPGPGVPQKHTVGSAEAE